MRSIPTAMPEASWVASVVELRGCCASGLELPELLPRCAQVLTIQSIDTRPNQEPKSCVRPIPDPFNGLVHATSWFVVSVPSPHLRRKTWTDMAMDGRPG